MLYTLSGIVRVVSILRGRVSISLYTYRLWRRQWRSHACEAPWSRVWGERASDPDRCVVLLLSHLGCSLRVFGSSSVQMRVGIRKVAGSASSCKRQWSSLLLLMPSKSCNIFVSGNIDKALQRLAGYPTQGCLHWCGSLFATFNASKTSLHL